MSTKKSKIIDSPPAQPEPKNIIKANIPSRKFVSSPGLIGKILGGLKETASKESKGSAPIKTSSQLSQAGKISEKAKTGFNVVRNYLPRSTSIGKTTAKNASSAAVAPSRQPTRVTTPKLSSISAIAQQGPSVDLPNLQSESPILLLPYRLETRFVNTGTNVELWLRVYPDQISINSHQEKLSQTEIDAGAIFWNQYWTLAQTTGSDVKGAWRTITAKFTPQRAAWIVQQTYPSNWTKLGYKFPTMQSSYPAPVPSNPVADATETKTICLPDRWTAFLYPNSGSPLEFQFTNPVKQDLPISPFLESDISITSGGVTVPDKIKWMINFDDAIANGMAVRIPLDQTMSTNGISRIVVLGLRASSTDANGKSILESLFNAHHYSDGLAFVPQGSPTKNTPAAGSAYRRDDPGFEDSFETELENPPAPQTNYGGTILATALGINPCIFDHTKNFDLTERDNASAMLTALWPATLGYYLRQMMGIPDSWIDYARRFAVTHVFARGPFPAFRIGKVPYGVLPTTSLALLKSYSDFWEFQGVSLVTIIQKCLSIWQQSISSVATVGGSGDPDGSLLKILGMTADPVSYNFRSSIGPQFIQNYLWFLGFAPFPFLTGWDASLSNTGTQLLTKLGYPNSNPPILQAALWPWASPISIPSVSDGTPPTSETKGLPTPYVDPRDSTKKTNYLGWLASADLDSIKNQNLSPIPNTLLYVLLRQSLLRLAGDLANTAAYNANITINGQQVRSAIVDEVELVNFPSQSATQRPWDFLSASIPITGPAGTVTMIYSQFLRDHAMINYVPPHWADTQNALVQLSSDKITTAELDRLLSETLAAMGSRIDPWVTGLAHGLLSNRKYSSVHVGGYAWIENLTPNAAGTLLSDPQKISAINDLIGGISQKHGVTLVNPIVYQAPPDNAGYIHAPSLTQGATAAILRNGSVSHVASTPGTTSAPFTIDLSSHRVRSALELLDGLRAGNSLTALLGYQFESMMNSVASTDPALTALIPAFEDAYPLIANKLTLSPGTQPTTAAAPNVVDGVALLADYRSNSSTYQNVVSQIPSSSLADFKNIMKELQDGLSALEDLFTAETVHQIQQGNTVRGGATLDSVENGNTPPEIQVLQTPRSGPVNTHRVSLLFPGDAPGGTWGSGNTNPRAKAEPWIHVWLGNLIPDPVNVMCQYSIGPPPDPKAGGPPLSSITLDKIGAGPIDFIAMSLADTNTPQLSELEARILDYIYNLSPNPPPLGSPPVTLVYARADSWGPTTLSIPEYIVVLRAFADLLGGSRPLAPADLSLPATGRTVPGIGVQGDDVVTSATAASSNLQTALTSMKTARGNLWGKLQMPGSNPNTDNIQKALRIISWFNLSHAIPADPMQARRLVPTAAISVGSTVAGASTSATVTFKLGSSDTLTKGAGTITIWTRAGTALSNKKTDYLINGTTVTANPNTNNNAVQLTVPVDIAASSQVTLTLLNMTNPASSGPITASAVTSGGSMASVDGDQMITALASIVQSDLITNSLSSGLPALPSGVSNVNVTATAAPLSITVQFQTSSSGNLVAGVGTISVSAPGGTGFSLSPNDYKIQVGTSTSTKLQVPKVQGSSVTITVPFPIGNGDTVKVVINNISGNLPATSQFSVWTSSDSLPSTSTTGVSIPSGGGTSLASASVNADPVSATYTLVFKPQNSLSANNGTVTVWAPDGMSFSSHAEDYSFSKTPPNSMTPPADPQVTQGQVTITVPFDIANTETVTLVMNAVQSPKAGRYGLSLATSADTSAIAAQFSIASGAAEAIDTLKAIFGRSFIALPYFVPRNLQDLINAFSKSPPSTNGDKNAIPRWIQQLTHVHPAIQRLDHAMGLAQVTNSSTVPSPSFIIGQLPIVPNDQWLALASRSSVSSGEVKIDDPTSSISTNYSISFTTSQAGSPPISGNSFIVITAPSGTTLQSDATKYSLKKSVSKASIPITNVTLGTFYSTTQNQATISLDPTTNISAGDLLTLVISGVTNPSLASDKYQLLIYTAADQQPAATSPYSITGSNESSSVPEYTDGRLDMVVLPPPKFNMSTLGTTKLRGLWIDGWADRIPSPTETTGLAFHYAEPLTQAPQVLLLAVNPTNKQYWTEEVGLATLRTIVEETLEMAKVRAVDDLIRVDGGEFLPAIYSAYNPQGDTVFIDYKIIQPWYQVAVVNEGGAGPQ